MSIHKLQAATVIVDGWLRGEKVAQAEALQFFNCVRMAIEASGYATNAPTLRSYCDLLFHENLTRKSHYGFLTSVSSSIRENIEKAEPTELLYGEVFLFQRLADELIAFFSGFQQSNVVWFLVSRSAELFTKLFENLIDHSISLEGEYPFVGETATKRRVMIYGHELVHVVKIEFGVEGAVLFARLHVMDLLEKQKWPMFIEVPVRLAN